MLYYSIVLLSLVVTANHQVDIVWLSTSAQDCSRSSSKTKQKEHEVQGLLEREREREKKRHQYMLEKDCQSDDLML